VSAHILDRPDVTPTRRHPQPFPLDTKAVPLNGHSVAHTNGTSPRTSPTVSYVGSASNDTGRTVQSTSNRRKVAVDIDGTLANFHDPCNYWLAAKSGIPPLLIDRWEWYEDYPDGKRLFKQFWQYVSHDPTWWMHVPVLHDVQYAMQVLRETHKVFYLTARNEKYRAQTAVWLARHGFYETLVHNRDKHLHADDFRILLDDRYDHVRDVIEHGGNAILVDRPWNYDEPDDVPRASSLLDAVYCIQKDYR